MPDTLKFSRKVTRPILSGFDLTPKERREFDYYDSEEELDSASFFRYKGNVYDLGEFMTPSGGSPFLPFWDGVSSDTYFSGVVVHLDRYGDSVTVARFYC